MWNGYLVQGWLGVDGGGHRDRRNNQAGLGVRGLKRNVE